MRPTSPSNRISRYYAQVEASQANRAQGAELISTDYYRVANLNLPARRRLAAPPLCGRAAGMAASLLQLAVSALCVAGALSTWLGHPPEVSPTMAVFVGGAMFGTASLLQLYSSLTTPEVDTTFAADGNQNIA